MPLVRRPCGTPCRHVVPAQRVATRYVDDEALVAIFGQNKAQGVFGFIDGGDELGTKTGRVAYPGQDLIRVADRA